MMHGFLFYCFLFTGVTGIITQFTGIITQFTGIITQFTGIITQFVKQIFAAILFISFSRIIF
jgi:hypothetical protein